jgi:hypothetical protein
VSVPASITSAWAIANIPDWPKGSVRRSFDDTWNFHLNSMPAYSDSESIFII